MSRGAAASNVWVAGESVGRDWRLIGLISQRHVVTVTRHPRLVDGHPFLDHMHLLVLDCHQNVEFCLRLLKDLHAQRHELSVVLVDGGLRQEQVAAAFASGIADYFASPYDPGLLAERIDALCAKARCQSA